MNNKGFISMTIVYTFLTLFLFLVLAVLSVYSEKNGYLTSIGERIRNEVTLDKGKLNTEVTTLWYNECDENSDSLRCKMISNDEEKSGNDLDYTDINTNGFYYVDGSKTEGDKRVYFYRGNVSNNNVLYNDLCFKIIRIDENGNVRLIYNGAVSNGACSSNFNLTLTSSFNEKSTDNKYVGFMYSNEDESQLYYGLTHRNDINSKIKNELKLWYENNLSGATKVVDAIYCNDRTVSNVNNSGYANIETVYAGQSRLSSSYSFPTYICASLNSGYYYGDFKDLPFNNMFSKTNIGNGLNDYPVGLITADELVFAGFAFNKETNNSYLSSNDAYMTMTPYGFSDSSSSIFVVSASNKLTNGSTTSLFNYSPVITIDGNSIVTSGTGSFDKPYWVVD